MVSRKNKLMIRWRVHDLFSTWSMTMMVLLIISPEQQSRIE